MGRFTLITRGCELCKTSNISKKLNPKTAKHPRFATACFADSFMLHPPGWMGQLGWDRMGWDGAGLMGRDRDRMGRNGTGEGVVVGVVVVVVVVLSVWIAFIKHGHLVEVQHA